MWTKASDTSIHVYNDPPSINGVALARGCTSISQVLNAEALDYTSRARTAPLGGIVGLRNTHGFYAAIHVLNIKDDTRGDDRDELRFRYAIQSDGSDSFAEFGLQVDLIGAGSREEIRSNLLRRFPRLAAPYRAGRAGWKPKPIDLV